MCVVHPAQAPFRRAPPPRGKSVSGYMYMYPHPPRQIKLRTAVSSSVGEVGLQEDPQGVTIFVQLGEEDVDEFCAIASAQMGRMAGRKYM